MTDQTAVYRPSPRPRPAGAPTRPVAGPKLHVVPNPDPDDTVELQSDLQPATCTASQVPVDHVSAGQDLAQGRFRARATGFATASRQFAAASRAYWTPPAGFLNQPASLNDLAQYARTAPWTAQHAGLVRTAGVCWYRYVGYPKTVIGRYSEWVWQRPGRVLFHAAGIKLVALTGPGGFIVDHVIYPAASLAGHIFL